MSFYVGAGEGKIIFDQGLFPLEGFCGIHDDPFLKVLVIRDELQVAVVSVDIVLLEEHNLEMIRQIVSEETGTAVPNIRIHMTHALTTPHPPEARRTPDPENADEEKLIALYDEAMNNAAREAARKAADMKEADVYAGTSHCLIHTSRNVKGKYGWWTGMNGEGPVDDEVTVLSFREPDGKVIASVINFGLKPCAVDNTRMDQWERLVSSDLTGVACSVLEAVTGAPALYMMAAAGDQVPYRMAWFSEFTEDGLAHMVDMGLDYGFEAAKEFGSRLGDAAIEAEHGACREETGAVVVRRGDFSWPEQEREGRLVYPVDASKIRVTGKDVTVPLSVIAFGDTAFVFTKPEMSCQSGLELKAASPYKRTILVTMTDGGMKYMPDRLAYERGYWVASNSMCTQGAAEELVSKAVGIMNEIKNRTDFSNIIHNKSFTSDMISFDPIPEQHVRNHGNFPKGATVDLGAFLKDDGSVFFRFLAPNAASVRIDVSDLERNEFEAANNFDPEILKAHRMPKNGRIIELKKQENGCFEGTLEYSRYASGMRVIDVYVDGTLVLDPYMPVTYIHDRYSNYVEIPDADLPEMLVEDVPHGTICMDIYWSEVMKEWVRQIVYLPPGYEHGDGEYPVMYLGQGRSQLETAWMSDGKLPQIMDNLIAQKRAVPCIIVMSNGMLRTPEDEVEKYDGFIRMICEDTIPFNENKYRIKKDKWNRAFAGLSMGGMQATQGGLEHPELFAWLGWFSCSIRMRDVDLDFEKSRYLDILRYEPERAAKEYRLIYKVNGISEMNRDRIVYDEIPWIEEQGIDKIPCFKREVIYDNGGEHEWNTWRRALIRFAEQIFR